MKFSMGFCIFYVVDKSNEIIGEFSTKREASAFAKKNKLKGYKIRVQKMM